MTPGDHITAEHVGQSLHLQIFFRGKEVFSCFLVFLSLLVAIPLFNVILGSQEFSSDDGVHAHPRLRIPRCPRTHPVGLFRVFAESEFQSPSGFRDEHLFRGFSALEFDDDVLPSYGVSATMHGVNHGHTACQTSVNRGILGVYDIAHLHSAGYRLATFIRAR